jgi:hypothetical protein
MIRNLSLGIALMWLTGCTSHYYTQQGGSLMFYLDKPDARQVIFASSLDDFAPHAARKVDGRWLVALSGPPRPFRYYYVVDGALYTPSCKLKENDDFGSQNCIFDPQL